MVESNERGFYIDYDGQGFRVKVIWDTGVGATTEMVSHDLEELLNSCKEAGYTNFEGLTPNAVDQVHMWLTKTKPAVLFVQTLWGGEGGATRNIGFRPPSE